MPYVKSNQVFKCPDDNGQGLVAGGTIKFINPNTGASMPLSPAQMAGHTYYDMYGASYKYTNQSYSRPSVVNGTNGNYTGLSAGVLHDSRCALWKR